MDLTQIFNILVGLPSRLLPVAAIHEGVNISSKQF